MQQPDVGERLITAERQWFAIGGIGGATAVIDYGGVRLVTEPTFDPPSSFGPYRKLVGPALQPTQLGAVDAVLLSHDLHMDNFDVSGREFAASVPLVVTGSRAAQRLGGNAAGLTPFESTIVPGHRTGSRVEVFAVPALHGPADGERDDDGNVNTEVIGFVLRSPDLPTVYVSGDNASITPVVEINERFDDITVGVLHMGAARVPAKFAGRPLTLTADRATDVAALLRLTDVIPVHCEGWSLYSQGPEEIFAAFADAGIQDRLRYSPPGRWADLPGWTRAGIE